MTVHFGEIDTYFVNVLSQSPWGGKRLMNVKGSFGKAILWFFPESMALPSNQKLPGQDVFYVYYRLATWDGLLDVLRNESPVYFNYSDTSDAAQIYTGQEPIGEGEIEATS